MTTLDRRSFLATATAAIATGAACSNQSNSPSSNAGGNPAPAASPGGGPAYAAAGGHNIYDMVVDPFLQKTKLPRFGVATPAAWLNFYGLVALVVAKDRASAKVFFPKSKDHKLSAWYLKGGAPTETEIKTSLTISGLKGALTFRDASIDNIEHASDSLSMLADNRKLGLAGAITPDLSNGIAVNVTVGQLFAGRAYSGDQLLMRTAFYKDQAEATLGTPPASGDLYALTDNFNWLAAIDTSAKFKLTIDGTDIEPELEPDKKNLRGVCITHDANVVHKPEHVLGHNRYFAKMVGGSETVNLRLPVCLTGQGGQTFDEVTLNSDDPICNGRIIWE
jgi:hypothetical protein